MKTMKCIITTGIMVPLLTLCACSEDLAGETAPVSTRQGIGFAVSTGDGQSLGATTRSHAESATGSVSAAVPMRGGFQSLYIRSEVINHIQPRRLHQAVPSQTEGGLEEPPSEPGATRGVVRTADNFYDAFGVFAYAYSGSWDGSQTPTLMYDTKAQKGTSVYETSTPWPALSENVRFYAYAPHSDDAEGISLSAASKAGLPQISYTVPTDVTKQSDLMATVCLDDETDPHTSPQAVTFHHLLTAVCFKTGSDMAAGTIDQITLKNIKYKGQYTYPTYTPWISNKGTWAVEDDVTNFTINPAFNTDGTANIQVNTDDQVFMMLPQTLTDDAEVEIKFTPTSGTTTTYTAKLNGLALWTQGQTVTYTISTAEDNSVYVLTVEPGDLTVSMGGAPSRDTSAPSVNILSYLQKSDGTQEPVIWYAEYYDEASDTWKLIDDSRSDYTMTGATVRMRQQNGNNNWYYGSDGDGGTFGETLYFGFTALSPVEGVNYHTERLKARDLLGSDGAPFDLSTHAIDPTTGLYAEAATPQNTANCYVVSQPGTYRFPVVYGNAIKNGAANTDSYAPSGIEEKDTTVATMYGGGRKAHIYAHFLNHLDQAITDPWLKNNADCSPADAVLVWQDEKDLITSTSVALDGDYIRFSVPQETIHQGNAMIAVRNSEGTIMWSWHIWVTDENIMATHDLVNHDGDHFGIMPVNLGWCSNQGLLFNPRSYRIRIRQVPDTDQPAEGARVAYFTVTQTGGSIPDDNTRGNCPFYQWGRKDPLLPAEGIVEFGTSPDKHHYDYNGYTASCTTTITGEDHAISYRESGKDVYGDFFSLGQSIRYPQNMAKGLTMWQVAPGMNLWSAKGFSRVGTTFVASQRPIPAEAKVIKTVYDPCPVGFSIPQVHAFTGMTESGYSSYSYLTEPTVSRTNEWNGSTTGVYFYCDPNNPDDQNVWFVPACGYRPYSHGRAILDGIAAGFWCAPLSTQENQIYYNSDASNIGVYITGLDIFIGWNGFYSSTGCGWNIRPMVEQ